MYPSAALAVAIAALTLPSPVQAAPQILTSNSAEEAARMPAPPRAGAPPVWASQRAGELTLDQQVGQVLIGGFDGQQAPRFIRSALRADRLSGVILFAANVGSRSRLTALTRSFRTASRGAALVSVDQEGGLVRRVSYAAPRIGQPRQGSAARVKRIARQGGADLRRLGFNLNFAPVADVPSGPGADIYGRAFRGSTADIGRKVVAATQGYRAARVAASVKHFPGLGSAPRNTDDAAVVITRSARALARTDLAPFRAAIAANAPVLMVSHARYSALDRRRLASQSPAILDRLLRRQLRYKGVVVTDALEARAVLRATSVERAAERSLLAGGDLLLLTRPASYGPVFRRIRARAKASPAARARLRESAARVLVLKRSLGLRVPGQ